ncbi:MBL fold metallo-hydrolase [Rubritalea marina]|uniref:MBL fold metallo-hydrolase n=1 Tax=Rubritalea marina TaxID=361055 RepID=UPI00035F5AB0|nr:MBL fold metallo-hydrolase [Rubritalea marina]
MAILIAVKMRMAVLGSGSGGNATLLDCGKSMILIDAGLSAKQLVVRMEAMGVAPDSLSAILLTHEHSDHARGLDVFLRKRKVPVYVNAMTKEALQWGMKSDVDWKVFQTGTDFQLAELTVHPFPIPHDAAEPVGFTVHAGETKFGLVTDVGYVTEAMRVYLKQAHGLFVEANYDEGLLEADTKRPWSTKQRIASRHGHLSNVQAGELIAEVGCSLLEQVVLGHLSSDCNTAQHATQTIGDLLGNVGLQGVNLACANQEEPTDWIEFGVMPRRSAAVLDGAPLQQTELF